LRTSCVCFRSTRVMKSVYLLHSPLPAIAAQTDLLHTVHVLHSTGCSKISLRMSLTCRTWTARHCVSWSACCKRKWVLSMINLHHLNWVMLDVPWRKSRKICFGQKVFWDKIPDESTLSALIFTLVKFFYNRVCDTKGSFCTKTSSICCFSTILECNEQTDTELRHILFYVYALHLRGTVKTGNGTWSSKKSLPAIPPVSQGTSLKDRMTEWDWLQYHL